MRATAAGETAPPPQAREASNTGRKRKGSTSSESDHTTQTSSSPSPSTSPSNVGSKRSRGAAARGSEPLAAKVEQSAVSPEVDELDRLAESVAHNHTQLPGMRPQEFIYWVSGHAV